MARRHGRAESSRPTQKEDRPSPRTDAICPYDKASAPQGRLSAARRPGTAPQAAEGASRAIWHAESSRPTQKEDRPSPASS